MNPILYFHSVSATKYIFIFLRYRRKTFF